MQKNTPILINVPHASTLIPPEEATHFVTPYLKREIAVMTDWFCDDLYNTGHSMLRFPVSRLICDPERFRNDSEEIMSSVGMGAIYTLCSDGTPLKRVTPEYREALLRRYYDPYHVAFETAVKEKLEAHGKCLIIDGHSFPAKPLPYELDQKPLRPDICIGTDDYHTPQELVDALVTAFTAKGYTVTINRPFSGSIVPLKYYRKDKRVMSVMIEINRRLYLDENFNKSGGYERVKDDIMDLFGKCQVNLR